MKAIAGGLFVPRPRPGFPPGAWEILAQLSQAHRCAVELDISPWEFAISVASLLGDGRSEADLDGLVRQGLVEHAWEMTTLSDCHRVFHRSHSGELMPTSCFVLTPAGQALVTGKGRAKRGPEV
jgi:hypothetical protein